MTRARDVANVLSTATTLATDTETAAAISSHNSSTTTVHGITDTAALATSTSLSSAISTHASAADPHTVYLKESEYVAAGKNKIINGDFSVNQRNATSTTSTFAFLADRWKTVGFSGTATWSISSVANGSFSNQFTNKAIRITSSSSSNDLGFQQAIEDVQTLAGQTVTVSFWARTSGTSYTLDLAELLQYFGSGGSANVYTYFTASGTTLTSTWTRYSLTTTLPSIAGKTIGAGNYLSLRIDPTTTLANGDWIEFTQIQLEAGSIATPFTTATGTIQGELAACQRYYVRWGGDALYQQIGIGIGATSSIASMDVFCPVQMRVVPTAVDYSTLAIQDGTITTGSAVPTIVGIYSGTKTVGIDMTVSGGAVAVNRPYRFLTNNSTSGYFGLSAEL